MQRVHMRRPGQARQSNIRQDAGAWTQECRCESQRLRGRGERYGRRTTSGRGGLGVALRDQRKKRWSHAKHRNGRTKRAASKRDSRTPWRLERRIRWLSHIGQFVDTVAPLWRSRSKPARGPN